MIIGAASNNHFCVCHVSVVNNLSTKAINQVIHVTVNSQMNH